MKKTQVLLLLATVFWFAACGGSSDSSGDADAASAAQQPITVKLATVIANSNPTVEAFRMFEKAVEEKSGGRIDVILYPDGQLGNSDETLDQLRRNDIQMSTVNPLSINTTITELAALDQFFMFEDSQHAYRVLDGEGGKMLLDSMKKGNFEGLGFLTLGFRQFSNSRQPINTLEDLQGLKIRGYNPVQIAAWESVGCVLTPVSWPELFTSLQQKLIDGQECANVSFESGKFYEAQNYISLTNHIYSSDIWIANQSDFMDKLSPEDAQLLRDEAKATIIWQRQAVDQGDAKLQETLINTHGVEINQVDSAVKAQMRELMNAAVGPQIAEMAGQDFVAKITEYVEAAR